MPLTSSVRAEPELVEVGLEPLEQGRLLFGFAVTSFGGARHSLQRLLDRLQVGKRQLGVNHLDVALGIDAIGDVSDVLVLEAAHDVSNRLDFADVGEELVAETFSLGRALDQACDVDELHDRRHRLLRLHLRGQRIEPRIRDRHDARRGLDRAERVVLGRDLRIGESVEEGRLADVGQADDAAAESHGEPRVLCGVGLLGASAHRAEATSATRSLPRCGAPVKETPRRT